MKRGGGVESLSRGLCRMIGDGETSYISAWLRPTSDDLDGPVGRAEELWLGATESASPSIPALSVAEICFRQRGQGEVLSCSNNS